MASFCACWSTNRCRYGAKFVVQPHHNRIKSNSFLTCLCACRQSDDGTFWIPWEYIKWRFMSIHVNWNPAIYPFSASVHGSYRKRLPDVEHLRHNPQYLLEVGEGDKDGLLSGEGGDILLVLHRHYKGDTFSVKDPLSMALHVYEGTGRVYSKEGALHQCTYRNSPYNTFRMKAPSDGKSSTYILCVGLW